MGSKDDLASVPVHIRAVRKVNFPTVDFRGTSNMCTIHNNNTVGYKEEKLFFYNTDYLSEHIVNKYRQVLLKKYKTKIEEKINDKNVL